MRSGKTVNGSAMSEISINEFVELLKKSGVVDAQRIQGLTGSLDDFPTPKHLAKSLLGSKELTEWQAKFLLSGRHRLQIGNYQLLSRIRRDEFGDRFLAMHQSLRRKVELQIFSKEVSADKTRRNVLLAKASLASKLDHPNLVHVYDIDHEGDRYYIVVEHVAGQPISVTEKIGRDESEIAVIIKACLSGLFYAHQHDVIHGAIVPEDLLLMSDDSVKIQNLSVQPLRQKEESGHQVTESDDFIALSNIGLKLLAVNKPLEPHEKRKELKQILAKLRKNPELVAGELDRWIEENPKRNVTEAPSVTLMETPKNQSGAHRLKKKAPTKPLEDGVPDEQGFVARAWKENPVKFMATLAVPLLLLNVLAFAAVYQWTRPQAANAIVMDVEAGNRSAAVDQGITSLANAVEDEAAFAATKVGETDEASQRKQARVQPNAYPVDSSAAQQKTLTQDPAANRTIVAKVPTENPAELAQAQTGTSAAPVAIATEPAATTNVVNMTPAAVPAGPVIPPLAEGKAPDNLSRIFGIGDKTESNLAGVGITTYAQLAQMTPADLKTLGKTFNRFGIPDPDRIIKEAKEFQAQLMANPAGGTGIATTVAPPKRDLNSPFFSFPERTKLPKIESKAELLIAPLTIRKQYRLGLDIVSPEGTSRTRTSFELERKDEGKVQTWVVGMKKTPKQKPLPVARFIRTESEFQFQWLDSATKNKNVQILRNCFVKLHLPDGESAVLSLRQPAKIPALRLDPKTLRHEIEFDISNFPDPERIRVEILRIDRGETEIDVILPNITTESNGVLFFRNVRYQRKEAQDKMWVEFSADFRSKMKVSAATNIIVGAPPALMVNDIADLKKLHQQLRLAHEIAVANVTKSNTTPNRSVKSKTEDDLNKMDAYMEGINQLLTQPIKIRVVGDFDGYQAVLAVSDPDLTPETYKKQRREAANKRSAAKKSRQKEDTKQTDSAALTGQPKPGNADKPAVKK